MSSACSEDDLPLVTIITPTYNSNPQYLKEAIESVLEQTYPKIEYIITDDGSSVFHEELIHELLEGGNRGNITWKIIRHEENVGTVKNMNGAIRESHGEYIFPLAHDDVYYDERVIEEWVYEFLKTGAMMMTGLRECWDMEQKCVEEVLPTIQERERLTNMSTTEIHNLLLKYNFIAGASTAQSRKCIDMYNLFDEKYRLLEDYPAYLKVTKNGCRIVLWERPVIRYRLIGITSNKRITHGNIQYDYDLLNLRKDIICQESGLRKIKNMIFYVVKYIQIKTIQKKFPYTCNYELDKVQMVYLPTKIYNYIMKKFSRGK